MKYLGILVMSIWMIPTLVQAEIRITEIAWMGTTESSFGEWFELYNNGAEAVDVSGWKLYKDNGAKIVFTLTKTIPAGGYLLVERTTPSMLDPVPSVSDEAGPFSNSGFANDGEVLVLKDMVGTTVQTLDYGSGWPAGDAATRQTMQWSGTAWVTGAPTPKNPSTESHTSDTGEVESEESVASNSSKPASSGGASSVVFKKIPDHIEFLFPRTIYRNVPYEYDSVAFFRDMPQYNGYFVWNMGDGGTFTSTKNDGVVYTYLYPGTYTVSFSYYNREGDSVPLLQSYKTVSVTEPGLILSQHDSRSITIKNTASIPIDLSKWGIELNGIRSVLPPHTVIAPQASTTFPAQRFGLETIVSGRLYTPTGEIAAYLGDAPLVVYKQIQKVKTSTTSTTPIKESVAQVPEPVIEIVDQNQKANHRTRIIILGAVMLVVIGACLLLDRIMIHRE